jgi:hypothetical protein
MNSPAQETDDTRVHLQTLLHRVRQALNECPADRPVDRAYPSRLVGYPHSVRRRAESAEA